MQTGNIIKAYKAFNPDWTCLGFQYAVGKTYEHSGEIKICESGFHACEKPLDVLRYYPPTSKFAEVELFGQVFIGKNSKLCAEKIKILKEIKLADLIKSGVAFSKNAATTGYRANAVTSGDGAYAVTAGYGANAATTGTCAHAATTGPSAHAATTGTSAHAATTGTRAHAATTGYRANAVTSGDGAHAVTAGYGANAVTETKNSAAVAIGKRCQAKAGSGGWIVLTWWSSDGDIRDIKSARCGDLPGDLKPDTFYKLDDDGNFVECQ